MSVDYITCDKCNANFPDCGPWGYCKRAHNLCERCAPLTDAAAFDDGEVRTSHCPVCRQGGTWNDRAIVTLRGLRLFAARHMTVHDLDVARLYRQAEDLIRERGAQP